MYVVLLLTLTSKFHPFKFKWCTQLDPARMQLSYFKRNNIMGFELGCIGARGEACPSFLLYSPLICMHNMHGHGDPSTEQLYMQWKDRASPDSNQVQYKQANRV